MPQKSSLDPRKKAALRKAVYDLLSRIVPVVREGGSVPLRSVTEAIAGEKIGSNVRRALDARGKLTFVPGADGKAKFENDGRATDLALKAFKLKIPERLSGWAQVVDGDQGVVLHFDKQHTLSACKMLLCAGVEAVELTKKRIFVDLEGKAFDRSFDLDGEEKGRAARAPKAPAQKGKRPAAKPEAPEEEKKPAARAKAEEKKQPAAEAQPKEEKQPTAEAKPKEEKQPTAEAKPQEEKQPTPEAKARKAERPPAKARAREEQPAAVPKSHLRSAVDAAKENVRAGVEKTLKSAAESGYAAKQAAEKAKRDAKTNVESGVQQARQGIAESRKAAKESARRARSSVREQLEHSRETIRGPAAKPQVGRAPRGGGYLGLTTYPVRLPAKIADEQGATGGLMVLAVQPDGPADQAGLMMGDTLLALGGRPMRKPEDLKKLVTPDRVGQRLEAVVLRAGKTTRLTVEVGAPGS